MIRNLSIAMLLGSSMLFAENTPTDKIPPPAAPAVAQAAPAPQQANSIALIKARLKTFKAEQKASAKVAKEQTKLAVEQFKAAKVSQKQNTKLAIEQAIANAEK